MIINNYNIYSNYAFNSKNNKFNPTFGYNLPKHPVSDIREISHLTCGCCGDTMLRPSKFEEFIQHFAPNSKRALENTSLNKYKDTDEYKFVKDISDLHPKMTIRNLFSLEEYKLKIKDLSSEKQLEVSKILTAAENVTQSSSKVVNMFRPYYEHFSEKTKSLLDVMEKYSHKYPNKTFIEIFNNPKIINKHQKVLDDINKHSVMDRVSVFREIQSLAGLKPEVKRGLQEINSRVITITNSEYYEPHIKKAFVEKLYGDFSSTLSDENLRKNIMQIIKGFSYKEAYADKFILDAVKSGKTDMDIVRAISEELLATFEHVQAKSKDGTRAAANGIVLCKKCNSERSNVEYPIFLGLHPEMFANMQKQINRVISFINNKKLIGYDSYPIDIKKTLLTYSDNILKINIRKFLKFHKDRILNKLAKFEVSLENDTKAVEDVSEKLSDLDLKLEEAMAVVKKLKKERRMIQENYDKALINRNISESEVSTHKDKLENLISLMDEDLELNKTAQKAAKKKS